MPRSLAFLAVILLGVAAAPAGATPPAETKIVIETMLPPEGPAFGPFTSSGGVVCPSGSTVDLFARGAGAPNSSGRLQLLVLKRFTCADGSGSFDLLFRVHLTFDPFTDVATWSVHGGTGRYERLHGAGTLVGLPLPGGVLDVLAGRMHLD